MTRLRTIIAATLLTAVALVAPAASHAADSGSTELRANLNSVVDPGDDDLVPLGLGQQSISLLGWGWGG